MTDELFCNLLLAAIGLVVVLGALFIWQSYTDGAAKEKGLITQCHARGGTVQAFSGHYDSCDLPKN